MKHEILDPLGYPITIDYNPDYSITPNTMKPNQTEGSKGVEKTFVNCFYRGALCPVREMQFHVDGSFSVSMLEVEINNMIKMVSPDSEHITNITMLKTNPQETNAKIIERLEQAREENAACIAALKELITIAEDAIALLDEYQHNSLLVQTYRLILERAKRITNGQQDKD